MENIFYFLFKLFISSAILLLYYRIALRNRRFHYYNRFYLLMAVAASLIIPFFKFQWLTFSSPSKNAVTIINSLQTGQGLPVYGVSTPGADPAVWIYPVWMGLSVILLGLLCMRIRKLQYLKHKFPKTEMEGFTFINTDLPEAPFSFLKNLFWRKDITLDDTAGKQILNHELTHIRQNHTYDKVFMQLLLAVFWMNPVYWIIQKELYLIHEFIADEEALGDKDADAFALMLLQSVYGKEIFSPAQSFSYSPIKRRLTMLTAPKSPGKAYARKLVLLPLLVLTIGLFAFRLQPATARTGLKWTQPSNLVAHEVDTVVQPHYYGSYDGQPVKNVALKQIAPRVIVTTKDGKKHEMTMNEARQHHIQLPPPPPPEARVTIVGYADTGKGPGDDRIKENVSDPAGNLLVIIDGEKNSASGMKQLNPSDINSINVLKNEKATEKYGEAGRSGVIEITTRARAKYDIDLHRVDNRQNPQVEDEPRFPGGDIGWRKFLERNLNSTTPISNGAPVGTYQVTMEFLVDENGDISEVKALNNPGYGMAQEAVRVFGKSPRWQPATFKGKQVAYRKRQSIDFIVLK